MNHRDFSEVGHTGGKVTFKVRCDENGRLAYTVGYSHASPRPMALVGIYAHPDGFACGNIQIGGIGQPWNPPPFPNCVAVMMASDSEGRFGHQCPNCTKHFRTESIPATFPLTCPYCGIRAASFKFLTPPQQAYLRHYVSTLLSGAARVAPNETIEIVIDMDEIADSVDDEARPDFYYSSITQQTQFQCSACNNFNDVRGRYAYCASCGWRNNLASLEMAFGAIRERVNRGDMPPSEAVKQAVSEFDSAARDFVDQLEGRIPMKQGRRKQLQDLLFHNIDRIDEMMRSAFDINLLRGLEGERSFIRQMFLRRHVYEHDGGVATDRYIRESGDGTVESGALIRENTANVHRLVNGLGRMARTLDVDFHEIFPPEPFCIEHERARRERMSRL